MKLHDLKPAAGSRTPRTRVGRGIAAGKGKTAGRGTKGQKARAGGSIPPWFEGGQTPLHMRIPKLRGFKNRFKVEYEIVNVGRIGELAALGAFETGEAPDAKKPAKAAPITVNQELLRAVGLVRTLDKPMKVLGQGDLEVGLFVVADAFSKSAVAKIEAAGGSVQVLEIPTGILPALGIEPAAEATPERPAGSAPKAKKSRAAEAATESTDSQPAEAAPEATAPEVATTSGIEADADAGEPATAVAGAATTEADASDGAADAKPARAPKAKATATAKATTASKPAKATTASKAAKPAKAAKATTKAPAPDAAETDPTATPTSDDAAASEDA